MAVPVIVVCPAGTSSIKLTSWPLSITCLTTASSGRPTIAGPEPADPPGIVFTMASIRSDRAIPNHRLPEATSWKSTDVGCDASFKPQLRRRPEITAVELGYTLVDGLGVG